MHIQHVILWEFRNNKNTKEKAKKISSVHGSDEPRPGCSSNLNQDALKELMECNPRKSTRELALDLNTSEATTCHHLKKISKQARHLSSSYSK